MTIVIGTTGADGIATATLTSLKAGVITVTATVDGKSQTVETRFVADDGTAQITEANLKATTDGVVANGTATNEVEAVVTDANGNPVSGLEVVFAADNGATITSVSGATGADGVATAKLTHIKAGISVVTATVNGRDQTVDTLFIADKNTATIADADFTVASGAFANGTDSNTLHVVVKDGQGNVVPDIPVTFAVTSGSATLTTPTAQTDEQGVAQTTLTSSVVGDNQVTATVGTYTTAAQTSTFTPEGFAGISTNGHTFNTGDGFPTTGFQTARFTLEVSGSASAYTWSSSQSSSVTVNNGQVTLNNPPSGLVTITATPKNGVGEMLSYSFTVKNWFINNGSTTLSWQNANTYCGQQPGFKQPYTSEINGYGNSRRIGTLVSEWGDMNKHTSARFSETFYWAQGDSAAQGYNWYSDIRNGDSNARPSGHQLGVICLKAL